MYIYVWLAVAAAMAVVEAFTQGLVTVWFVAGALAAFVAALVGADVVVQMVLFLVVSVVCLVALRPFALRFRRAPQATEPTMVGKAAVVCEPLSADGMTGRVRTSQSMTWKACTQNGEALPIGTPVVVVAQDSAKLIVERKPS
ncbi:NfeD family protein [Eggerthellaceae bacterium zg-887]|uniref:NfeD family protein n=1 Tax=Xiamenia xianingshaonis TaxID=2682776 RepID=UPI00140B6DAC|nr:NfeD family protein [Xiamenia xianingshaonis]NHM16196.1 NfeD family protein [Xiamenia xianingshaonis]